MVHQETLWRVAIVDQRSGPAKLWQRALQGNHRIQFFGSCDELVRRVNLNPERQGSKTPHLFIIDWDGSDGNAARFIKYLRRDLENGSAVMAVVDEKNPTQGTDACCAGANEFISRPIDQFELASRVENLLNHRPRNLSLPEHYPPFCFDLNRRILIYRDRVHRPRPREFDMLLYFFRRPNEIISREKLAAFVWFGGSEQCRSVDTYISRVRRLYGLDGDSGWMIKSVYGKGYSLIVHHS